jgi:hypothetical protein
MDRHRIRHAIAHAFEKAKKHQRAIAKRVGFLLLLCIAITGAFLWQHRGEPRIVNYASDLIPGVLAILIAFIPDLRTQHMTLRLAIVAVGIIWSVLLWQKETLTDAAQVAALNSVVTNANAHSDAHSEAQTAQLRKELQAATIHSDERSDGQIETVNKRLGDTSTAVISAFSTMAEGLNKQIEGVHPGTPGIAKLTFCFWSQDIAKWPILAQSVLPDPEGTSALVDISFRNTSKETAKNVEFWLQVCDGCSFAKEPSGFEKFLGSSEQVRHRRIGDLHPGVFFEKTSIEVGFNPAFSSFAVSFSYACDNCPFDSTDDNQKQSITVLIARDFIRQPSLKSGLPIPQFPESTKHVH